MNKFSAASTFDFSILQTDTDRYFKTVLKAPRRELKTPFEEAVIASNLLIESIGDKKPILMMKPNYESYFMFQAFIAAKIDFKVGYVVYSAEENDFSGANMIRKLCESYNRELSVLTFDFENPQHYKDLEHLVNQFKSNNIEKIIDIWSSCQVDDYPVFAGHFCFPYVEPVRMQIKIFYNLPDYTEKMIIDFFEQTEGVPNFLSSTPELANSFLQTKLAHENLHLINCGGQPLLLNNELKEVLIFESGLKLIEGWVPIAYDRLALNFIKLKNSSMTQAISFMRAGASFVNGFSDTIFEIKYNIDISSQPIVRKSTSDLIKKISGAVIELTSLQKTNAEHDKTFVVFPEVIKTYQYADDLVEIKKFIERQHYHAGYNNFLHASTEKNLHHSVEMLPVLEFFHKSIKNYLLKKGYYVDSVEINQCWANKTQQGQSHHRHLHLNSYLSGVFYLSDGGGDLNFHKEEHSIVVPFEHNHTPFNMRLIKIRPSCGQLVVFPSGLWHSTNVNSSINNRYSVSFNCIVRGQIGTWESASWMDL